MADFRVRRDLGDDKADANLAAVYGDSTVTLQPGVIKNNRPKALKWLKVARTKWGYPEAYLETRDSGLGNWRRTDD